MAYVNGNLALSPKRKQQEELVIRETRKKVVRKKSIPIQEKLLYLFTVLIGVVIAGIIIFRYAQIYDLNLQIKQINTEMQAVNVEVEELKRQVEMLSDPVRIHKIAESQGMLSNLDSGIVIKKSDNGYQSAKVD